MRAPVVVACAVPLVLGLLASACGKSADAPVIAEDSGAPLVNVSKYNTVLGRPTDTSIAVSVLANAAGDAAWIEFSPEVDESKSELRASQSSAPVTSASGEPIVIELTGLTKDTLYYYRVHMQPAGAGEDVDTLHSFRTQRAAGKTFHFGVQGDTHPERYANKTFNAELFTLTMEQVRNRQPDFYFTLGDDFSIEKIIEDFKKANYPDKYGFRKSVEGALPYADYEALASPFVNSMLVDGESAPAGYAAYQEMRTKYFGLMANATSLFLVNGNHEEARSASLGGIFNNSAVWAADGRLKYYPLPSPGAFYSVDSQKMESVNGYPTISAPDGLLRDYYAFTWGDALFVTIDPYWHDDEMPETTLYNGDPKSKDVWKATMGDQQYAWLKQTLESSTAKWKFIFTHHINGTGRGGAGCVGDGEWGGATKDFAQKRPTWEKPIHQLLVDTKVTVFFQAHDHIFARESVDGVIYQSVPNPGDNSYFAYNCDAYAPNKITWEGPAGYGVYDPSYSVRLPNTGFLDVAVSPESVRIDYVRTYRDVDLKTNPNKAFRGNESNGEVAFSYSVPSEDRDTKPSDITFSCPGDAPPDGWVYNP